MNDTREILSDLINTIGGALNRGHCKEMRFAIVIWCDCIAVPLCVAGNENDTPRTLKMLKLAADDLLSSRLQPEGSA
jgi:hypothetical protein